MHLMSRVVCHNKKYVACLYTLEYMPVCIHRYSPKLLLKDATTESQMENQMVQTTTSFLDHLMDHLLHLRIKFPFNNIFEITLKI